MVGLADEEGVFGHEVMVIWLDALVDYQARLILKLIMIL
jgi:hypothetical protein